MGDGHSKPLTLFSFIQGHGKEQEFHCSCARESYDLTPEPITAGQGIAKPKLVLGHGVPGAALEPSQEQ